MHVKRVFVQDFFSFKETKKQVLLALRRHCTYVHVYMVGLEN